MPLTKPLSIAFVWHMHQPYYRDLLSGDCSMPWVRLHGTKDYLDMVKLLGQFPALHQTFNLVPSLLDQIEEYLPPASRSDRFLDLSRKPAADLTEEEKRFLLEQFFMANWDRMIKPYPRYHDLLAKRGESVDEQAWPDVLKRFKTQDYVDLVVWFNLVWIDPWIRQHDPELSRLEAKGTKFTEEEKRLLLDKQLGILGQIVSTYKAFQDKGQIELTTSPYYHPIAPLLCDIRSAHRALPDLPLPKPFRHPEDAAWHIEQAVARHEALFGRRPSGMWPPEGSVSEDLVRLAMDANLRWIATDEEILWRTLQHPRSAALLYKPHVVRRGARQLTVIFRDRELSDLIGFVYSRWEASLAIQDFLNRLEGIRQQLPQEPIPPLVSIILDGENAWEHYPHDGHDFLQGLYEVLGNDERFRLVTVSEYLNQVPLNHVESLPELFAGSWIDGNFSTWVGHPEKNTAWNHLSRARQDLADTPGRSVQALQCLYVAEGSDWMWWFGDTHSSAQDEEFDRLFRTHLINMYRLLGQEAPEDLQRPITRAGTKALVEPWAVIHPTIDGRQTTYYEWLGAGHRDLRKGYGATHRGQQFLQAVYYGCDQAQYYFRLDVDAAGLRELQGWYVSFEFSDRQLNITLQPGASEDMSTSLNGQPQRMPCAYAQILELALPKSLIPAQPGEICQLRVSLYHAEDLLERYPADGTFQLLIPPADFELQGWSA